MLFFTDLFIYFTVILFLFLALHFFCDHRLSFVFFFSRLSFIVVSLFTFIFDYYQALDHVNLCEYVEIVKGAHGVNNLSLSLSLSLSILLIFVLLCGRSDICSK